MKESRFREAVQAELRKVPLGTRRLWDDNNLFAWWMKTTQDQPEITQGCGSGDPWQHVKGACKDLIRELAM